jgi:DNA-binding transcriptional ArsR family regulator
MNDAESQQQDDRRGAPKAARAAPKAAPAVAATGEPDPVFAVVARYFGVLSEPTRLNILHTICQDERSVTAIVAATGATHTNVSRDLALRLAEGIVSRRRAGNVVFYRGADPESVEIWRTVCMRTASRIDGQKPLERDLLQFAAQR